MPEACENGCNGCDECTDFEDIDTTSAVQSLLPCPFCGAAAHFEMDADRWEWIECESCCMQGNRSASLMEDCRPKLAEAWNRRAQPVAREPLTDEQIAVACGWKPGCAPLPKERDIARAIERAHGIT